MPSLISPTLRDGCPIRVAVLVTLHWTPSAGGHVKVWERFAAAAAQTTDLDLTIFFLGAEDRVVPIHDHARFHLLPPRLGTDRLPFLDSGAGHTDLASFHPRLAALLAGFDLLLSTDHFSFGKTARQVARKQGIPIAHSIHTDVETLARTYGPNILRQALGSRFGGWLADGLNLGDRIAKAEGNKLRAQLAPGAHIFVSRPEDTALVQASYPGKSTSLLRRGIDLEMFSPDKRDRSWLAERFGRTPDQTVAVFAGRADGSKRVLVAAQALRILVDRGHDLTLIIAGSGSDLDNVKALLGDHVLTPGSLPQADLARLLASADLFLFPSESETFGNVALEARAAGLAAVLSARPGGTARWIREDGVDGYGVAGGDPEDWARALEIALTGDTRAVGRAARRAMEQDAPTWTKVFEEDLMPHWRRLADLQSAP
ncbi:glycosyltransferase [Rhodospirillum sp. A1_3_36]|uniref:glycosyltransferase n=1 Tax=Rhodospirillum sp. A1_3_36 TaxID=3391666 RepID=UPI0039A68159